MSWIVNQIGARQHYAVARALHRRGWLDAMYTDVWCRFAGVVPARWKSARALAGRYHPELRGANIVSFNASALRDRVFGRQVNRFDEYLRVGERFGRQVASHLAARGNTGNERLFAFNTGALEPLKWARERGVWSIVDQIDPARAEEDIVVEESLRFPGWESQPVRAPLSYWDRLQAEWDVATTVLVNSPWCADALKRQGVPSAKIAIVPHAFEAPVSTVAPATGKEGPVSVLWLGQVNLRKGIPYLLEAGRRLGSLVRIDVVGALDISAAAAATAPSNVYFHGPVSRADAQDWYRRADVFVLPTLSDGFAITQLEAMSQGLPVIATPNCGEVVTNGRDGFIVPIRDPVALADAIERLARDSELRRAMGEQARMTARKFTLDRYAQSVDALLAQPRSSSSAGLPISAAAPGVHA